VLLVIVGIFALPKILGHRSDASSSAATASAPPAEQPKPTEQPARRETRAASEPPATRDSLKTAEKKRAAEPQSSAEAAPSPASVRTDTFPSANAPSASASSPESGEVLEEILPEVSEKARATIQGVVRVSVRVHVDPTGNVSEALLDSAGPSKYFADLALKTARRWQFSSPDMGGHSVPSEWLIRFQFSRTGPKAFPKQITP
jgi:protein TonB